MSTRPTEFLKDGTWKWDIFLVNSANVAVDADSTPTVTVYKNGTATGESVTVTKPSATTGWYQCSFNPAGEAESDIYGFSEVAIIATITYPPFHWKAVVKVAERGTDSAALAAGVNVTQLAGQTVTAAAGVTFPSSIASPTNITEGTITTVTNLTNAPTSGDFTATMKSSITTAVPTEAQIRAEMDSSSVALAAIYARQGAPTGLSQSADIAAIAAKLPASLVDGKMSCHVVTIADDAVNVAATDALLVSWIQENLATTAEVNAIPLAALLLDWTDIEDTVPSRSMLNALRHIRNKWSITDLTKTVMCEDGTTPAYTTTITVDSNGNITADTPV